MRVDLYIFLIAVFILPGSLTSQPDTLSRLQYEVNIGTTFSQALRNENPYINLNIFKTLDASVNKYSPFNNTASLKIGIIDSVKKVEIGTFYYKSKFSKEVSGVKKKNFTSTGVEILYYPNYMKKLKKFKNLNLSYFFSYGLNLGYYNGNGIIAHRFGGGVEFTYFIYKGLFVRNNTSIVFNTNRFPVQLLSQFYLGYRF